MWNIHAISMVVSMYVCIYLYTQYIAYVENCIPLYLRQKKHENQILRKQLLPPSFSWVSRSPVRTFTLTTAADSKNPSKNHSHPTPIYPQKKRSTHLKWSHPSTIFSIQFHLVSHFDIQIHDLIADGIKTALDVIRICPTGLWHTWQHDLLIQLIHCRQSIQTCFVQRRPSFQALVKYRSQTSPEKLENLQLLLECSGCDFEHSPIQ